MAQPDQPPPPAAAAPEKTGEATRAEARDEAHTPLTDALHRAAQLMILLERHLDRAAGEGGGDATPLEELGRAWVRAAQLEQLLRGVLPPGATFAIEVSDPDAAPADAPQAEEPGEPARDARGAAGA